MNSEIKNSLLEFHFGLLDENQRLQLEKEMITDPEMLINYLDLKREVEGNALIPQQPSPFLWQRLQRVSVKKKSWFIAFAVGAVAATLACFYILAQPKGEIVPFTRDHSILFDSSAEHSFASDVL